MNGSRKLEPQPHSKSDVAGPDASDSVDRGPNRVVDAPKLLSKAFRPFVVLTLALIFALGRISASVHPIDWMFNLDRMFDHFSVDPEVDPAIVLRTDQDRFSGLVEAWNEYVVKHGGELPADPYRALFYSAKMDGGYQLRDIDFVPELPPRINPDLKENGKWIIFSRRYFTDAASEQWQCYADGTWARIQLPKGATSMPADFGMPFDPHKRLRVAGYPVDQWKTDADRASWLARNAGSLVWYQPWRMYVVSGNPATRAIASITRASTRPGSAGSN